MKGGEWWSVKFNLAQSEVSFFEAVSDPINTGLIFNISPCSWKWYQPEETRVTASQTAKGEKRERWQLPTGLTAPLPTGWHEAGPWHKISPTNLGMQWAECRLSLRRASSGWDGKGILVLMWRKGYEHCLGMGILLKNRINTSKRWHPPPQGTAVWGVRLSPCWLYRPSVGTHCNHSGLMGVPRQPWAIREDATDLSSCRSHYLNSPYSSNSLGKASHHRATWGSQRREKA